jgi:uncharacterized membrane protein SpoIIM required for sporulation
MNLERFVAERDPEWSELEQLVRRAGRRPERLGAESVLRLGALYRAAAADLAYARRRFGGDPVVARLERLVGTARHLVYARTTRRASLRRFVTHGYWRLVAERPAALLVAALLLALPASLGASWAVADPGAAAGIVPEELRDVTEASGDWDDLPAGEQAAFSSYVLTNNVRVAAFAFAGGILVGLPTALVLVFNGLLLGAVGGLLAGGGAWEAFVTLVTAHGVLELSCIVVAGAAGLRLGWSVVEPGRLSRRASLAREAPRTVALLIGTAPWLGVAALVEGFRGELSQLGIAAVVAVGTALGALYWGLVLLLGRRDPGFDPVTGAREP